MVNWIVRNKYVWSFNCVYLQIVFTDHMFNIYLKIGFGINNGWYAIKPKNTYNKMVSCIAI